MYDELLKRLRNCATQAAPCKTCDLIEDGSCSDTLMKQAADAIEELSATVSKMEKATRWIPVTERLPKADEYDARGYAVPYLVMNGWMRVTARRTKDYWVLFGNGTVLEYVTHWMPLPTPPKEDT